MSVIGLGLNLRFLKFLLIFIIIIIILVCILSSLLKVWLSVSVQSIACKDSSPK